MAIEETKDIISIHFKEAGYKFNGKIWTKSSDPVTWHYDFRTWADNVEYCSIRGAQMQTLDSAVEFRHGTNGADNSEKYQHTGTLIALVKYGKALRAHIYEPGQEELEQLASRMGTGQPFIDVNSTSDLGRRIIDSTKQTRRTFIVPEEDLELSVLPKGGHTDYGTNKVVLQLMPRCAEKNAAYVAENEFERIHILFDRPVLESGQMRIRPVGLGYNDYDNIEGVRADNGFDDGGWARGEIHVKPKKSTGKEALVSICNH
jgi:hypothetical protein